MNSNSQWIFLTVWLMLISCYIRHLAWTVGLLSSDGIVTAKDGVLAVLGTLAPPIGAVHGFLLFGGWL